MIKPRKKIRDFIDKLSTDDILKLLRRLSRDDGFADFTLILHSYTERLTDNLNEILKQEGLELNKGEIINLTEGWRFTEALISYDRVIDIDPTFFYAWNNRSSVLRQLGRIEEPFSCLQLALSLDPDYFETVDELSVDQMKK